MVSHELDDDDVVQQKEERLSNAKNLKESGNNDDDDDDSSVPTINHEKWNKLCAIAAVAIAVVTTVIIISFGNKESKPDFKSMNTITVCVDGQCVEPSECWTSDWYDQDFCNVEGNVCIRDRGGDQWDCGAYGLDPHNNNNSSRKLIEW